MKKTIAIIFFALFTVLFAKSDKDVLSYFDLAKEAYGDGDLLLTKQYLNKINTLINLELNKISDDIIYITNFVHEFDENEIAAARKYGGKKIKLKGYARSIERMCDPRIGNGPGWVPTIKLGDQPYTRSFIEATCYCSLDMEDVCANLKRGAEVIIEGTFYENTYHYARLVDCIVYPLEND